MATPIDPPAAYFGDIAARLAGLVCALLGWQPGQFWRATPDELAAIFAALTADGAHRTTAAPLDRQQLQQLKEIFPDDPDSANR